MYYANIRSFLETMTEAKASSAKYKDIMDYIGVLRKQYSNPGTIKHKLQCVKKYYHWLIHTGQRKSHPCRYLNLKDAKNKDIQLQDLFSKEELELLLTEREEKYPSIERRNQVIITLLIYQALAKRDIAGLRIKDVNLEQGTIYIKQNTVTTRRTLKLRPEQIMLLHKYMTEDRPVLLKRNAKRTEKDKEALLLSKTGMADDGWGVRYLVKKCRHLYPGKTLNAKTIRMSVITNLLKEGMELRAVQVFAGHKNTSSTEKYRQTQVEELKKQLDKYHPLG